MVKNLYCSSRRTELSSQHPHDISLLLVILAPEDLTCSSSHGHPQACTDTNATHLSIEMKRLQSSIYSAYIHLYEYACIFLYMYIDIYTQNMCSWVKMIERRYTLQVVMDNTWGNCHSVFKTLNFMVNITLNLLKKTKPTFKTVNTTIHWEREGSDHECSLRFACERALWFIPT